MDHLRERKMLVEYKVVLDGVLCGKANTELLKPRDTFDFIADLSRGSNSKLSVHADVTVVRRPNKHKDKNLTETKLPPKTSGIPMPELLIGYYFDVSCHEAKSLYPQRTEAWDFGTHFIGDLQSGDDREELQKDDAVLEKHRGATTLPKLQKRFEQCVDAGKKRLEMELPSMPSCTLNTFDPAKKVSAYKSRQDQGRHSL